MVLLIPSTLHSRPTLPARRLVTRAYASSQLRRSSFGPHAPHATLSRGTTSSTGTSKIGRSRTRRSSLSWIATVDAPQPLQVRAIPAIGLNRTTHQRALPRCSSQLSTYSLPSQPPSRAILYVSPTRRPPPRAPSHPQDSRSDRQAARI